MKQFEISTKGHRKTFDISASGYRKEFDITSVRRMEYDLVIENMPSNLLLFAENKLAFGAGEVFADDVVYQTFYVDAGMLLNTDVLLETEQEFGVVYNFGFGHTLDVYHEQSILADDNGFVLNSEVDMVSVRYRYLGDMDNVLLSELDAYTLGELDYMTEEISDG